MGNKEENQESNQHTQGWKPSAIKNDQDNWVSLVWGREGLETHENSLSILEELNSGQRKWFNSRTWINRKKLQENLGSRIRKDCLRKIFNINFCVA